MRLSGTKTGAINQYRGLGNQLWDLAGNRPSLDLPFADNKSLVDATTGAQLVTFTRASLGTYVDSEGVIQIASTDEPRFDHNPTTGESLGLLVEKQRTNLLLNSGTLSTQSVTVTAAAHTLSFTGTGTITLTGTSTAGPLVGTGTGESNRVSLTFTPTAGSLTLTVSGTITDAQLEVGSFRTSYIPTTDAEVTRAADVASISGSNFSSWYRQDEGTVFAEFRDSPSTQSEYPFAISDNTSSNRFTFFTSGSSTLNSRFISAGSSFNPGDVSFIASALIRACTAGKTGADQAITACNGVLSNAGSPTSMPAVDRMYIGAAHNGLEQTNGTIRRLTFWPARLPNETLQTITQ